MTKFTSNDHILGLNWRQPFATAMLKGKIETRTWPTDYRGWVLIIASQSSYTPLEIFDITGEGEQMNLLAAVNKHPTEYITGHAIAIGRLVNCRPMKKEDEHATFVEYKEPWEYTSLKTGKKTWRRLWCHVYEDVIEIIPFEIKGAQKWKKISYDIKKAIIPCYENQEN